MSANQYINTFTGETIIYNEQYHTYTTVDGKRLLGASTYAKRFGKDFPKEHIISKLTQTWDMPAKDIDELWGINGRISTHYGSAIHEAMELWFRYHKKGKEIQALKSLEHNYALPKHPYLRNMVLSFVEAFGDLDGVPEVTLSAVEKGMAGRTDLLVLTGEKTCRVGDYKMVTDMADDKLLVYQHQLSFYADMLTHHGWTVEGLDIYHHDGAGWTHLPLEVLPVELPTTVASVPLSPPGRRPPAYKGV